MRNEGKLNVEQTTEGMVKRTDICNVLKEVLADINETGIAIDGRDMKVQRISEANKMLVGECMAYMRNADYEHASILNRQVSVWAKKIQKFAMNDEHAYLYMLGKFNGAFGIYKNIINQQSEEKIFTVRMSKVIERKGVKKILRYLYEHEYAQNKIICEALTLEPNLLNKKMKPLIAVGCVERIVTGKYVFYALSVYGKRYVKNTLGFIGNKILDTNYANVTFYAETEVKERNRIRKTGGYERYNWKNVDLKEDFSDELYGNVMTSKMEELRYARD